MTSPRAFLWLRISGLLTIIPIILAAAPLAGYLAGDWLVTKLRFPRYATIVCVIIGFIAAVRETVKIIRMALKAAKESG